MGQESHILFSQITEYFSLILIAFPHFFMIIKVNMIDSYRMRLRKWTWFMLLLIDVVTEYIYDLSMKDELILKMFHLSQYVFISPSDNYLF